MNTGADPGTSRKIGANPLGWLTRIRGPWSRDTSLKNFHLRLKVLINTMNPGQLMWLTVDYEHYVIGEDFLTLQYGVWCL